MTYKVEDKIKELTPLLDHVEFTDDELNKEINIMSAEIIGDIIFSMRMERDYNFLAVLMDNIDIYPNNKLPSLAACSFRRNCFNIEYNPFIIFTYDKYTIRGAIKHELYHILNRHLQRGVQYEKSGDYSHDIVNIGMDVSINQYINELEFNNEFITLESFRNYLSDKTIDVEEEREFEYYVELLKDSKFNNSPKKIREFLKKIVDQNKNNQQNQNDDCDDNDNNTDDDQDNEQERERVVKKRDMEQEHSGWDIGDVPSEVLEHQLKEMIQNAIGRTNGSIPANIQAIIDELFDKPIIRWQDVLRTFMGKIPMPFKYTRARLNRRMPTRLDLSGKLPDRYYPIVCCFDTSASVSEEEIQICLNEVWNIVSMQKRRFEITVICCDAEINSITVIKKKDDFKKIKICGRGGTAFSPVFEYLKDNRSKYKDAVVIYFTDGYGESELSVKPLNNNNIWVLTENEEDLSLKEFYGKRVPLNLDKLIKKGA